MNILFVSSKRYLKQKTITKANKNNTKIISLKLDLESLNSKLLSWYIKSSLKWHFGEDKVYVVIEDRIDELTSIKKYLARILKDFTIINDQNNLLKRDYIYINEYILKNKLKKKDIKVLLIIDKITKDEKEKIEELIQEYKIVDIYSTRQNTILNKYIDNLNKNLGTVIQILDKMSTKYYNILLVFSKEYINIKHNSSFILDYNNSDLDTKSNVYLAYKNNEKQIKEILNNLDINSHNFKYAKLGKLCIHLKWNNAWHIVYNIIVKFKGEHLWKIEK